MSESSAEWWARRRRSQVAATVPVAPRRMDEIVRERFLVPEGTIRCADCGWPRDRWLRHAPEECSANLADDESRRVIRRETERLDAEMRQIEALLAESRAIGFARRPR